MAFAEARPQVNANLDGTATAGLRGSSATSRSGTITSGATAQDIMAANASRNTWTLINTSDTIMYVSAVTTATAVNGIPVNPGQVASGNETNAISVLCATTGKTFGAWEN